LAALYALCDKALIESFEMDFVEYVEMAKFYKAEWIQYRNKLDDDKSVAYDLEKLKSLWDGVLIVNDRLRLASLCDGLHIGQEDLNKLCEEFGAHNKSETIKRVRDAIQDRLLGLSTHDLDEVEISNGYDLDYIGIGAYRNSGTKSVSSLIENLSLLIEASFHKTAVIGGVRLYDKIDSDFMVIGRDLIVKWRTFS